MFIEALFTTTSFGSSPDAPQLIQKMWYIYTREFLFSHKEE
jgi:hypothetical protein